jgi:hypothetical protein
MRRAAVARRGMGCYEARMTWPFPLPDWLPWWVPLAVLVPALFYAVLFLAMPFSVFGLKGRLDQIEERLEEIQDDIRRLAARPPETNRGPASDAPPGGPRQEAPPTPDMSRHAEPLAPRRPAPGDTPRRVEPRLDWPRE